MGESPSGWTWALGAPCPAPTAVRRISGFALLALLCVASVACAGCSSLSGLAVYPFGWVDHRAPTPVTNEGNADYVAITREGGHDRWIVEGGAATYVDSYGLRSYALFGDVRHRDFRWGVMSPMVSLGCHYKGKAYGSAERKLFCHPPIKFRLGGSSGLVLKVAPVPRVSSLTNGFVAVELGYRFP